MSATHEPARAQTGLRSHVRLPFLSHPTYPLPPCITVLDPPGRDADARLWLQSLFPPLFRYHDYLHGSRGDPDTGLVFIQHPWEAEVSADSALWPPLLRETRYSTVEGERGVWAPLSWAVRVLRLLRGCWYVPVYLLFGAMRSGSHKRLTLNLLVFRSVTQQCCFRGVPAPPAPMYPSRGATFAPLGPHTPSLLLLGIPLAPPPPLSPSLSHHALFRYPLPRYVAGAESRPSDVENGRRTRAGCRSRSRRRRPRPPGFRGRRRSRRPCSCPSAPPALASSTATSSGSVRSCSRWDTYEYSYAAGERCIDRCRFQRLVHVVLATKSCLAQ